MLEATKRPPSQGYFGTLSFCILASLALLFGASLAHVAPGLTMVGGVLPLIYYHVFFLAPRARRGLSAAAIDSVYYFGFLVTIGALGASAVRLAVSGGKEPLETIAFQFGLGLLATGYAVMARMHLTSLATLVESAGPEAILDQYMQRSVELISNVELASTQFVTLANSLMEKTDEVAQRAQASAEAAMVGMTRSFDEEMRKILASGREGLVELRALVSDAAFDEERKQLAKSIKLTLEHVESLNVGLAEFASKAANGAQSAGQVAAAGERAGAELTVLAQRVESLSGADGHLVRAAQAMAEAQDSVGQSGKLIGATLIDLHESAQDTVDIKRLIKNIKTLVSSATEQMNALAESTGRLQESTANLAKTALVTNSFAGSLDRAASVVPGLASALESSRGSMEGLSEAAATAATQLKSATGPAGDVVKVSTELQEALRAVQGLLSSAGVEAKALAGATAENAKSLQLASTLVASMPQLQLTSEALQRMLSELSGSVQKLQLSLSASSDSLERDVAQSGRAAKLFVEKLTESAQVILDHTRQTPGVTKL